MAADRGMTVLLGTHDIDESGYLAGRVLVLSRSPPAVTKTLDVDLPGQRNQITAGDRRRSRTCGTEVARLLRL